MFLSKSLSRRTLRIEWTCSNCLSVWQWRQTACHASVEESIKILLSSSGNLAACGIYNVDNRTIQLSSVGKVLDRLFLRYCPQTEHLPNDPLVTNRSVREQLIDARRGRGNRFFFSLSRERDSFGLKLRSEDEGHTCCIHMRPSV